MKLNWSFLNSSALTIALLTSATISAQGFEVTNSAQNQSSESHGELTAALAAKERGFRPESLGFRPEIQFKKHRPNGICSGYFGADCRSSCLRQISEQPRATANSSRWSSGKHQRKRVSSGTKTRIYRELVNQDCNLTALLPFGFFPVTSTNTSSK